MRDFIGLLDLDKVSIKTYNKDSYICFENDECSKVYLLISGHIRISSLTSNGQEIIYKDLYSNDLFGHNLLFSNNPYYRGDVVAIEKSSLIEFNDEDFIKLLSSNKDFLREFLNYQSEDSKKMNQTIKVLSIPSCEEKLLYLLQINRGLIKIKSITDLSRKLNITREATSRTVHSLIKQNKLTYIDDTIKLKDHSKEWSKQ